MCGRKTSRNKALAALSASTVPGFALVSRSPLALIPTAFREAAPTAKVVQKTQKSSPTFGGTIVQVHVPTGSFHPRRFSHDSAPTTRSLSSIPTTSPLYRTRVIITCVLPRFTLGSVQHDPTKPTSIPRNSEHRVEQKVRMPTQPREHCPRSHWS